MTSQSSPEPQAPNYLIEPINPRTVAPSERTTPGYIARLLESDVFRQQTYFSSSGPHRSSDLPTNGYGQASMPLGPPMRPLDALAHMASAKVAKPTWGGGAAADTYTFPPSSHVGHLDRSGKAPCASMYSQDFVGDQYGSLDEQRPAKRARSEALRSPQQPQFHSRPATSHSTAVGLQCQDQGQNHGHRAKKHSQTEVDIANFMQSFATARRSTDSSVPPHSKPASFQPPLSPRVVQPRESAHSFGGLTRGCDGYNGERLAAHAFNCNGYNREYPEDSRDSVLRQVAVPKVPEHRFVDKDPGFASAGAERQAVNFAGHVDSKSRTSGTEENIPTPPEEILKYHSGAEAAQAELGCAIDDEMEGVQISMAPPFHHASLATNETEEQGSENRMGFLGHSLDNRRKSFRDQQLESPQSMLIDDREPQRGSFEMPQPSIEMRRPPRLLQQRPATSDGVPSRTFDSPFTNNSGDARLLSSSPFRDANPIVRRPQGTPRARRAGINHTSRARTKRPKALEDDVECAECGQSTTAANRHVQQWIQCNGCSRWYHYSCVGFESEKDIRSVDKFHCRSNGCQDKFGPTTYVRKSTRAHVSVDYARLTEGVVQSGDDTAEHHYIAAIKADTLGFAPENFPRMRPEHVTADFFEKCKCLAEPIVIPVAWNPPPNLIGAGKVDPALLSGPTLAHSAAPRAAAALYSTPGYATSDSPVNGTNAFSSASPFNPAGESNLSGNSVGTPASYPVQQPSLGLEDSHHFEDAQASAPLPRHMSFDNPISYSHHSSRDDSAPLPRRMSLNAISTIPGSSDVTAPANVMNYGTPPPWRSENEPNDDISTSKEPPMWLTGPSSPPSILKMGSRSSTRRPSLAGSVASSFYGPGYAEMNPATLSDLDHLDRPNVEKIRDVGQDRLGMVIPQSLTVHRVAELYGENELLPVIDVKTQQTTDMRWTVGKWADYYVDDGPDKTIYNVISLEVSQSPLGRLLRRPDVVRDLDLTDSVWPKEEGPGPRVGFYVLMGVKDCFTDFHIDFGGSSVYYHILRGKKTFFFIPPKPRYLKMYEEWNKSASQNHVWLGSITKECYRVDLSAGDTMIIPAGWIHAVWTPENALVIGGNFLTRLHYRMQFKIVEIEKALNTAAKFTFPNFQKVMWYTVLKYLNDDPLPQSIVDGFMGGKRFNRAEPLWMEYNKFGHNSDAGPENYNARYYPRAELDGLPDLLSFIFRTLMITLGRVDGVTADKQNAVTKSIPKNRGNPLEIARRFAIWVAWKRGNEDIPHWAHPEGIPHADEKGKGKKLSAATLKKLEKATAVKQHQQQQQQGPLGSDGAADLNDDDTAHLVAGFPYASPKNSVLGPKRSACDQCRKRRVACKHKLEVRDAAMVNGERQFEFVGSNKANVHGRALAVDAPMTVYTEDQVLLPGTPVPASLPAPVSAPSPAPVASMTVAAMKAADVAAAAAAAAATPLQVAAVPTVDMTSSRDVPTSNGLAAVHVVHTPLPRETRNKACAACRKSKRRCLHDDVGNIDPVKVAEASSKQATKKRKVGEGVEGV